MAIRNMLHISKLKAFEAFLESKGSLKQRSRGYPRK